MSQNEVSLQRQLSAMPVNAGLDRMSGPGGHPSVTLRENGRPDRMIQVFIKAEPVDQPRPIVSGRPDVGIGQDDRGQHVMGQDTSRDRWRPAALGGGAADPFFDTGVSGNLTFRDSSSHNYTVRRGDRDERKIYEEGTADTLAQSIRYSVTVVEKKVLPGGRERVVRREPVAETALGTAYLTMFDTDHAAMRGAGDEAGGLRPWLGEPVAPTGARRGWRLPLPSHPRILMLSLDAAAEAAAQRSGPDAADLREAITDEVRRRLRDKQWRSAAMLQLNVNASVVSGVDLDALAQEIAKARGGGVIIDVTAPDQTVRHYGRPPAHPD